MKEKSTFIVKTAWESVFTGLTDAQAGVLIKAIFAYVSTGEVPDMTDPALGMALRFVCLDLDSFDDKYRQTCEKRREGGAKGAEYGKLGGRPRKTEETPKTPKGVMKTPKTPCNDNDNDNENENKPPIIPQSGDGASSDFGFENAWQMYGRKGNKKSSARRWKNLTNHKQTAALEKIPAYVLATPDVQYRKNFETWINGECWNDELIPRSTTPQQTAPTTIDYSHIL